MTRHEPPAPDDPPAGAPDEAVRRRRFLTVGAGVGAVLLAGCSADPGSLATDGPSPTSGSADGSTGDTGTFRLFVSDQPAAIGDFDSLEVSFDRARVFRGEGDDDGDEAETTTEVETETNTATETEPPTEAETGTEVETETDTGTETATTTEVETEDEASDGGQRGFFVLDLEGATVDLTQVVGEAAMGVFEGELEAGRYTKVELYAADVVGVVGGEEVDVKIPSGKLQLVKPFEVVPGETLEFVFDINVVKKGPQGGYNLLPVISESGVAGEEVEMREVERGRSGAGRGDGEETDETEEPEAGGGGPPDDGNPGNRSGQPQGGSS